MIVVYAILDNDEARPQKRHIHKSVWYVGSLVYYKLFILHSVGSLELLAYYLRLGLFCLEAKRFSSLRTCCTRSCLSGRSLLSNTLIKASYAKPTDLAV
jgi:hypothetical protein